MSCRWLLVCS